MDLPKEIQTHVDAYIQRTDWQQVTEQIGNPCAGCPGRCWVDTHPEDRHTPPCFSCPLWALKCDLALLALRRRLDRGNLT